MIPLIITVIGFELYEEGVELMQQSVEY